MASIHTFDQEKEDTSPTLMFIKDATKMLAAIITIVTGIVTLVVVVAQVRNDAQLRNDIKMLHNDNKRLQNDIEILQKDNAIQNEMLMVLENFKSSATIDLNQKSTYFENMKSRIADLEPKLIEYEKNTSTMIADFVNFKSSAITLKSTDNICLISALGVSCPQGFTGDAVFGFLISRPGKIPSGMSLGGGYNSEWRWMHGRLCCKSWT
jgi:hypothetical protein